MEKVESCIKNNYCAPNILELGFDDVARNKIREILDRNPPENSLTIEENEVLMFLLSRAILN